MPTQITPMFEPAGEEQVRALERQLRATLPADYRAFLLAHNGGTVEPDTFLISPKQGRSTLDLLYGITKDADYDLYSNAVDAWEDAPRSLLPIGEDPGGNRICISLAVADAGRIFFRDHELPMPDALTPVAAGFTEFLDSLHEMP